MKRLLTLEALLILLIAGAHVSVQAQRRSPRLSAAVVKIRVRANDSIATLAERYNVPKEELALLNNRAIDAELQPGEEIYIPAVATISSASISERRAIIAGTDNNLRMRARAVEPAIVAAAVRYGVDPRVLWTIAFLETRFQPGLISPKGARGMMQFMPGTAARYGLQNPHDANAAIDAAARYVRDLARRFNNRFELVLASYNAGEGAVEAFLQGVSLRTPDGRVINPNRIRTGGIPPYTETREYVERGLVIARQLTTANVFATVNSMARNTLLFLPSEPGTMARETGAGTPSEYETAQVPPTLITPTSSYAFNRTETDATEETNAQPSPQSNRAAPVIAARSFRVSAMIQTGEPSERDTTNFNPSYVPADAPATTASQPRSTRVMASAPHR